MCVIDPGGGDAVTVKLRPLLDWPPTVTTTLPVVAPFGTGAVRLVLVQFVGVAVVPLKLTMLAPCEAPKLVPVMITELPTAPEVGDSVVMLGGGGSVTVNETPLLACPLTVTTTLPVVAPVGTG